MIIDTHLHVWSDDFNQYPFAEGFTEREGAPIELLNRTMADAGVDKAVIVQPIYYLYDHLYVAGSDFKTWAHWFTRPFSTSV